MIFKISNARTSCLLFLIGLVNFSFADEILVCNGFVKSEIDVNFSQIGIKLYTKQGSLKDHTECAPNNGYYFLPLYDKGEYILKVDPPKGWTFEPSEVALNVDGTTDPCSQSKDINFVFKGFAVTGKVISFGNEVGPAGVKVELFQDQGKLVQSLLTGKDGNFVFTPVLPGKHLIRVSHASWKLSKNEVNIEVKNGNAVVPPGSLEVSGYEVSGSVTSDNEPITGVTFILFGTKKPENSLTGCDSSPVAAFSSGGLELQDKALICHVGSDSAGRFSFPSLPPGRYTVVPHYKGAQNIKFDVHPPLLQFTVSHDSVLLSTPFQVKGFSVSGRVLWSKDGKPIPGASVLIANKVVTKTGVDGTFHLESMRAGTYLLSVKANDVLFKETEVKVTPKTPFLPDMIPETYKVCGNVKPSTQPGEIQSQIREVQFMSKESGISHNVKTNAVTGDFCTFLAAGVYHASVPVTPEEKKNKGLQFAPIQREVTIKDQPISGIDFSQLRATVRGQIFCLGSKPCPDITVVLTSKQGQEHLATSIAKGGQYVLENVLPGEYVVTLDRVSDWCWDENSASLSVSDAETKGPTFTQTGISITFVSSHTTKVHYKLLKDSAAKVKDTNVKVEASKTLVKESAVPSGKSKMCVPDLGEYEIEIVSCHGYIVPKIHWKGGPVVLTAISHSYTGYITSQEPASDIKVVFTSKDEKSQQKVLLPSEGIKNSDGEYEYKFVLQLGEGEKISLTPSARSLLFNPPTTEVVGGSDCEENGIKFVAEKGKLLKGCVLRGQQMRPPLPDAFVSLLDSEDNVLMTQSTDSSGCYTFGPLSAAKKYKLTASKEGYIMTGPNENGDFSAHKMAEVVVEVKDKADSSPLQGVLLSLSGGENYRRNSATGSNGKMDFISLSPGEYFLRPMMKEYRFDPPSKMISVKEGATVNIILYGNRVAYSVFGSVTSLSGDPEVGVVVEAVGVDGHHPDCSQLQEESTSETSGLFRIRGLQPQCNYTVRVKQGEDINEHLRRATPDSISVKVTDRDIQHLRLIVFRQISQTDLTVFIESDSPEHLRSLKAKLYRDEVAMHSIRLSDLKATPTFSLSSVIITFPPLVPDGRSYSLQLESSLSQATYTYTNNPVHFKANSSFRLVRLSFLPQPRSHDSELSHTSYFVIPLLLVVVFIYYNQAATLEYLNYFMQMMQARVVAVNNTRSHVQDDLGSDTILVEPVSSKRKMKPRKT